MPGLKNARDDSVSARAELLSAATGEVRAVSCTCKMPIIQGRQGEGRQEEEGDRTLSSAESASWMSPRTSWPTGMPSIWSTSRTMLSSVSVLPQTFSMARRRRSASSSQSVNGSCVLPSAGVAKRTSGGRPGTPRRVRSW